MSCELQAHPRNNGFETSIPHLQQGVVCQADRADESIHPLVLPGMSKERPSIAAGQQENQYQPCDDGYGALLVDALGLRHFVSAKSCSMLALAAILKKAKHTLITLGSIS